ncbi:hypothetical protein HYW46_00665 [Candidatus Daviesbacteria bacterium]|nr:hypothetical protein [Candidatus Daviesbacteria bacterium]
MIIIVVIAIVTAFLLLGFLKQSVVPKSSPQTEKVETVQDKKSGWKEGGVAIAGGYADAEVVDIGDDKYRMYYSVEPEVPGNNLEIYSSTSTNGINWTKEGGIRKEMVTFPDVVKLADGTWRMYFQNAGIIKSAVSKDGLTWTDEPGVRVTNSELGFTLDNIGAQGTYRLDDGIFIMLYRGVINEVFKTADKVPNQTTGIYFWATSKDGLTFEKKGLAIDSRNETLLGAVDGAEWVKWDNGELRVYIWSYAGVFHVVYKDGIFSQPIFDFTTDKEDPMAKFSPNPPGDPTIMKINGKWFMYYGQHTKGIYYATF